MIQIKTRKTYVQIIPTILMLSIKFKLNLINKGKHFKLFFFLIAAYIPFFSVSGSF